MNKKRTGLLIVSVLMVLSMVLTACSISTQVASCAYLVGVGYSGYDAEIHGILYPGQSISGDHDGEVVRYVPCNSRNYIVNDGTKINANGQKVGDQFTLIKATTQSGTQIEIAATAFWTLNQSSEALKDFYSVCFKYECYTEADVSGNANFSTEGWNGMLSENFGPSLEAAARKAAYEVDDSVWQTHDPAQYELLADKMSQYFGDEIRARFGFTEDLFCGSGNSGWTDPNKPGVGEFTCTPVRITVDDVQQLQIATDTGTPAQLELNAARLSSAEALYGEDASYWLGLQDTIATCRDAGVTCVFNIGGGSLPVSVPVTSSGQ